MSVGEFAVAGYTIYFRPTIFSIHKEGAPSFSLRIGVLNFGNNNDENLEWEVHSTTHATIQTGIQFMRLIYYEPNNISGGNGQIEVSIKTEGQEIPSWSTLMNGIPRLVIVTAIGILNGDDDVEAYRVRRNNEGEVVRNANDPELSNENVPVPGRGNNNGNNPSGNNAAGGRRRRRQTRKPRRH